MPYVPAPPRCPTPRSWTPSLPLAALPSRTHAPEVQTESHETSPRAVFGCIQATFQAPSSSEYPSLNQTQSRSASLATGPPTLQSRPSISRHSDSGPLPPAGALPVPLDVIAAAPESSPPQLRWTATASLEP